MLLAGIALALAALVGGGVKLSGVEVPVLKSPPLQIGVGLAGVVLVLIAILERVPGDVREADLRTRVIAEYLRPWLAKVAGINPEAPPWFAPAYRQLQPHTSRLARKDLADTPVALSDILASTRRALVLGEPGDGKTTLLLLLARSWRDRALSDPSAPVPLYINLTTFSQQLTTDNRSTANFGAWLANEVRASYRLPAAWFSSWLKEDKVALILDGLDEVAPTRRLACARGAAAFLEKECPHASAILACRTAEFESLYDAQLLATFPDTISVSSPGVDALRSYVAQTVPDTLRPKLASLVNSGDLPFLSSTIGLSMLDDTVRDLVDSFPQTIDENSVINHYTASGLEHHLREPDAVARTERSAELLAANMQRHSLTIFYPEAVQPTWLRRASSRRAYSIFTAVAAAAFIIYFWLSLGVVRSGPLGYLAIPAILYSTLLAATVTSSRTLRPARRWRVSPRRVPAGLLIVAAGGLVGRLILGPLYEVAGQDNPVTRGTFWGLTWGCLLAAGYVIDRSHSDSNSGDRFQRIDVLVASLASLVAALIVGIAASFGLGILAVNLGLATRDVGPALALGIAAGLFVGRAPDALGHALLRVLLYIEGTLSLRVNQFFDTLVDCDLGRRAGTGYYFRHRRLQEHLAEETLSEWPAEFGPRTKVTARRPGLAGSPSWYLSLRKAWCRLFAGKYSAGWVKVVDEEARRHRRAGRYRAAGAADLTALDVKTRLYGPMEPAVADSLCNLGIDYLGLAYGEARSDNYTERFSAAWEIYTRGARSIDVEQRALWAALALAQLWQLHDRQDMVDRYRAYLSRVVAEPPALALSPREKALLAEICVPGIVLSVDDISSLKQGRVEFSVHGFPKDGRALGQVAESEVTGTDFDVAGAVWVREW
jgi:hypothetical protein